jgi:hypothetical protein
MIIPVDITPHHQGAVFLPGKINSFTDGNDYRLTNTNRHGLSLPPFFIGSTSFQKKYSDCIRYA